MQIEKKKKEKEKKRERERKKRLTVLKFHIFISGFQVGHRGSERVKLLRHFEQTASFVNLSNINGCSKTESLPVDYDLFE